MGLEQLKDAVSAEVDHLRPIVEGQIAHAKEVAKKFQGKVKAYADEVIAEVEATTDIALEKVKDLQNQAEEQAKEILDALREKAEQAAAEALAKEVVDAAKAEVKDILAKAKAEGEKLKTIAKEQLDRLEEIIKEKIINGIHKRGIIRDFFQEKFDQAKDAFEKLVVAAKAKLDQAKAKVIPALQDFINQIREAAKAEIEHLKPIVDATIKQVIEIAQKLEGDYESFIKKAVAEVKAKAADYLEQAKE